MIPSFQFQKNIFIGDLIFKLWLAFAIVNLVVKLPV